MLEEQLQMGWDGLTREVVDICHKLGLPNACTEFVYREEVAEAIMVNHLRNLKEEYGMEKLKHLKDTDIRYMQPYMKFASLENARIEFKFRVRMLDNRANMGKKYKSKACPHCPAGRQSGVIETSQHWFDCDAYKKFREGVDPEMSFSDRVVFLRRVQLLRIELEKHVI